MGFQGNLKKLSKDNAARLRKEILELGFSEPVSVWEHEGSCLILNGHQRVAVLKMLAAEGYQVPPVPVSLVEANTLAEATRKVLALTSQYGSMSVEGLGEFMLENEIPYTEVVESFRFPEVKMSLLAPEEPTAQDAVPEIAESAVCQPGELVALGDHRLLCGDATKPDDVRRLMGGRQAILFATDPPYLVGYDGTNHPHAWKNKDWSGSYGATWDEGDKNAELYDQFVKVAVEVAIEENAAWYCWHASRNQAMLEAVWNKHGVFVHQQIIWVKDRAALTHSWYMWQHEPCLYGWIEGDPPPLYIERHEDAAFGWLRGKKPPRVALDFPHTVWDVPTTLSGQTTEHPTSKPIELFAIPIRQHTRRGDVCYEPFAGSGSQIIAAEQLGRVCLALEISPAYCDLIVRRYYALVGWDKATEDQRDRWRGC